MFIYTRMAVNRSRTLRLLPRFLSPFWYLISTLLGERFHCIRFARRNPRWTLFPSPGGRRFTRGLVRRVAVNASRRSCSPGLPLSRAGTPSPWHQSVEAEVSPPLPLMSWPTTSGPSSWGRCLTELRLMSPVMTAILCPVRYFSPSFPWFFPFSSQFSDAFVSGPLTMSAISGSGKGSRLRVAYQVWSLISL